MKRNINTSNIDFLLLQLDYIFTIYEHILVTKTGHRLVLVTFCSGAIRLSPPTTITSKSTQQQRHCPPLFVSSPILLCLSIKRSLHVALIRLSMEYIDRHSDDSFLTWLTHKVHIPKTLNVVAQSLCFVI